METKTSEKSSPAFIQDIKDVRRIYKTTTRLKNKSWYKDPFQMNTQLHIFIGKDTGAISYIRRNKTNQWEKGPNLNPNLPESIEETFVPIIQNYVENKKHAGLGVIFYIADKFQTGRINSTIIQNMSLNDIREEIVDNPKSIIEGSNEAVEQFSWRAFPVSTKEKAVAVGCEKKYDVFMKALCKFGEKHNIPITTRAVSAPLCALSSLPYIIKNKPNAPFFNLLMYPKFTTLSIYNDVGDLLHLQALDHVGNKEEPNNLPQTIELLCGKHSIENPYIFIIPMGSKSAGETQINLEEFFEDATVYSLSPTQSDVQIHTEPNKALSIEEKGSNNQWDWASINAYDLKDGKLQEETCPQPEEQEGATSIIPNVTRAWSLQDLNPADVLQQVRLEIVGAVEPTLDEEKYPLYAANSFKTIVNEAWGIQNFLPQNREQHFPSRNELKLYKYTKLFLIFGTLGTVAFSALQLYKANNIVNTPEWSHTSSGRDARDQKSKQIITKHKELGNIMVDRSSMWSTLELPSILTNGGDTLLTSCKYFFDIDSFNRKNKKGYSRNWVIAGYTNNNDIDYIMSLNTENGVNSLFDQLYKTTGDENYNLDGRQIPSATITTQENRAYNPDGLRREEHFQYKINLSINQVIEPEDENAFNVKKKK